MVRFFWLILLTFCPVLLHGQAVEYARSVVDTLASEALKGRGYVQAGDRRAAAYIRDAFAEMGLLAFDTTYFQPFTTPVNTFPGTVALALDGQAQVPGETFLVEPGSPSVNGTFETVWLEVETLLEEQLLIEKLRASSNRFLVIPPYDPKAYTTAEREQITGVLNFLKYHPNNPAAGTILLTESKLSWSGATAQHPKPTFTVRHHPTSPRFASVTIAVASTFIEAYPTQNVVGYLAGTQSDSLVVLVAHYDHLGMMGADTVFPGANDNASGVAMLLSLARHYSHTPPRHTTVFIAFGAEEIGLVGAKHFVENPPFDLKRIKFLLNFDLAGTGDEGIQVVNGSVYPAQFDRLRQLNAARGLLPQVKVRGEACNSDHCVFHQHGVPAFFIYTLGGIAAYHDPHDRAETLPLTAFENYFLLMTAFIDGL